MNIRLAAHLERALSKAISWRKKELTAIKLAVDTASKAEQTVLLRAATTLLYAHWEGFVKEAGTCYLQLVANQGLTLGDLKPSFMAVSVRSQIATCARSTKVSVHKGLVEAMTTGLGQPARIVWKGVLQTRSNLNADVLKEIVTTLDLDYAPFDRKAKPVINRLVKTRNKIAHGHGYPVEHTDYTTLHSEVIGLLDEFKTQLEDAASSKKYKL